MLKWLHYLQRHSWQQTGLCVRSATKGFRGTRTFSSTGEDTIFHGSWSKGAAKSRSRREPMFALSPPAFTTTPQGLWEISLGSKSTFVESTERRSGSVTSAQRSMLFNLIGRLTLKPVALESIDVTVEPFFPGTYNKLLIIHSSSSIIYIYSFFIIILPL